MVPKDWEHPKNESGHYQPKFDRSYESTLKDFQEEKKFFNLGLGSDGKTKLPIEADGYAFEDWHGWMSDPEYFMPDWDDSERTHLMMYETTSEGTPISPAFETPEELAQWLFDNDASAFGSMTATHEQWLSMCKSGWAVSAAMTQDKGLISGVEALAE
jgi:hypothetical protein